MKKVFALILIAALVSSVFCFSANAVDPEIAGASVQAAAGEEVDVPVTISGNPGFMYLQVFVSVDEGLEIVSIGHDGADVNPAGMSFSATSISGGYNVSVDHSENITGNGLFFTVRVKVADDASGTLNVNFREGTAGIFNYDEDPVEFNFVAGEVEVEAAAEAPAMIRCNMDIFQVSADILSVQGWAGANYPADALGYKVDGGEPVFDGSVEFRDFNTPEEGETIKSLAGQYAFRFASPAAGISLAGVEAGEHTITLVLRVTVGADTAVLDMASKTFTISHEVPAPSLHAMSFDNIFIDGDNKTPAGNAGGWIAENPNFGDVQNIGVRGWAWVDNGAIGQFGYQIDSQDPVFSAAYLENRADLGTVLGTTMDICNGFQINPIDVSGLESGEHTFCILLTSNDDTVLTVTRFTFTVERPEPPVVYSLLNVSYDTLRYDDTTLVDGSADKWIHNLEDPSVLDFQVGTVSNITVRGWVRISENAADIAGFGYSIDGGAVVTNASFVEERSAELAGAGFPGAQGFTIIVPVGDLASGQHSIDAYVIAADGTEIKIVKDRSTTEVQDIRQVGVTFNVTDEVQPQPVALHGFSFDTLWLDYNQMVDGEAGKWIEQHPNFGFINVISVRGWAWIDNGAIESFGYGIDEGEPVFDAAYIEQRADVQATFGVTADEANGFFINPIDVSALKAGDHRMRLYVKATDGSVVEITSFAFTLERAGWLCNSASGVSIPGLWMTQPGQYIDINFTSPEAFKGFCAMIYSNVQGVTVEFSLIHEGKELESFEYSQAGDAAPTLFFERAYPAGTYTLRITAVQFNPHPDVGYGWFVLGTSDPIDNGYPVTIEGTHTLGTPAEGHPDSLTAPLMFLVLAESAEDLPADPAVLHAMSFNTVWVDGTQICDIGDALAYLAENPIDGDIASLAFRGWAWIDNSTIESFGYSIDGGEPVFDAAFTQDRPDVYAQPGATADVANGFNIQGIDVSGLATGEHTATLYVKAADGTVVEIVEVPFNVTRPAPTSTLVNMSFNTVWVDGNQICDTGDALGFLAQNPIDGDIQSLAFRGWAWIADSTIESFGYSIDGGEPVFDAAFTQDRPDVYAQPGATADVANGFNIQGIDVSGLATGAHTATLYVKAADGNNIVIVEVPFNVTRPAPAYELLNVSYDELKYDDTQLFSGSVDKKIAALEDASILDFEEGAVSNITVRGWVRISENVADIAGFGYSIDGGEVVQGEFVQDRVTELAGAGFPGAQGFEIIVPVADLAAGAHSIDAYVIAADGTQIKIVKVREGVENQVGVTFNVTEAAVVPVQPTNDAAIIAIAAVACVAAAGVVIGKKKLGK